MTVVQDAIYDALVASAPIVAALSTFRGQPAVFTRSKIPDGAEARYIVIDDSLSDTPYDTKTTVGREVLTDIGIFDDATGDPSAVQDLAELVHDVLHRQTLAVSGYGNLISVANGPIVGPTDDQMYGRIVTVRLVLIKA